MEAEDGFIYLKFTEGALFSNWSLNNDVSFPNVIFMANIIFKYLLQNIAVCNQFLELKIQRH